MLGTVFRSRALAPASIRALTRLVSPTHVAVRASPSSTPRTFASSSVFRDAYSSRDEPYARAPRRESEPSSTLYIGNLPFSVVKEHLQDTFGEFGTIASVRLGMSPSGESRGFAHVEFTDIAGAQNAMDANAESQLILEGRELRLDWAGPTVKRVPTPSTNLYFAGYEGDEASLEEMFAEFKDTILRIRLMRNPQTGGSSNFGFIDCATIEDATTILEKFNGKEVGYGQTLQLSFARIRGEPRRGQDRGEYSDRGQGGRGGYGSSGYGDDDREYRPRQGFGGDRGRGGGYDRGGGGGSYRGRDGGSYQGRSDRSYGGQRNSGGDGDF